MKEKDVLNSGLSSKKMSSCKRPINVVIKGNHQSIDQIVHQSTNQRGRQQVS